MTHSKSHEVRKARVRRAARFSKMGRWVQPRVAWPIAIGLLAVVLSFLAVGFFTIDALTDILRPYVDRPWNPAPTP